MRAVYYTEFKGRVSVETLADPAPEPDGVVIAVRATGLCRSDWHGWMGHDPDISVPHVPGHELAGVIEAVGSEVSGWKTGDRVTLPFVCGCGKCEQCASGHQQVCDRQFQPGFTHWGSFAEYVSIHYAEQNLVRIPDAMGFETAASLGCRFATSFRAVVDQGRVAPGDWVAVHGCGGVGLSAIMIAAAFGAQVIAVDISEDKLELARQLGAVQGINATDSPDIAEAIKAASKGGVHISLDALGDPRTCFNSVACLRKRGRHVQVGILSPVDRNARVPTDLIIANELEILGSHGMQAHRYPEMLKLVNDGKLRPGQLIGNTIGLDQAARDLVNMDQFKGTGVTIINRFG